MPLKQSLQELLDEMEFDTPEDKVEFEKFLAKDKLGASIESRVMKNKDYTTKTQQIAETKRQLEAEKEQWNQQQDTVTSQLQTYKTDLEGRLNTALRQAAESNAYGAALKSKLQTIAAQYGEDVDELLKDVKEMRTEDPKDKKPVVDDEEFKKNFVPRAEYEQAASQFFGFSPMLRDLEREYERLSGKPFDGSMQELVGDAVKTVTARRNRGEQIDIPTYIREKLDFKGLQAAKEEQVKAAAQKEREEWEKKTREDIEKDIRSKIVADNPRAFQPPKDEWRDKLGPKDRQADRPTQQDRYARQRAIHAAYEERAQKSAGA